MARSRRLAVVELMHAWCLAASIKDQTCRSSPQYRISAGRASGPPWGDVGIQGAISARDPSPPDPGLDSTNPAPRCPHSAPSDVQVRGASGWWGRGLPNTETPSNNSTNTTYLRGEPCADEQGADRSGPHMIITTTLHPTGPVPCLAPAALQMTPQQLRIIRATGHGSPGRCWGRRQRREMRYKTQDSQLRAECLSGTGKPISSGELLGRPTGSWPLVL